MKYYHIYEVQRLYLQELKQNEEFSFLRARRFTEKPSAAIILRIIIPKMFRVLGSI